MDTVLAIIGVAVFAISILPVHVYSYAYVSTADKLIDVSCSLYKLIPIFKFRLTESTFNKLRKNNNGAGDKKDGGGAKLNLLEIYNKLCILKIVQLSDFGLLSESGAYAAVVQNAFTELIYAFVKCNGGKTKLRNFVVLNYEHGHIGYYVKVVGVINLITLSRLFTIYLWSKFNEGKNQTNRKRAL